MIVILDTNILVQIASPQTTGQPGQCKQWFLQLLVRGGMVVTSEICDYETRRGLILASLKNPEIEGIQFLVDVQMSVTGAKSNSDYK